ncbi:MAG TPA: hypothetical protein VKZ18_07715 [Polyangia bacterium]|nr:hypothetical protein [Polyangia bacterium]
MDYRLVAPPRATALRFLCTSLTLGLALGCAGKGGSTAAGGTHGAGGSSAQGGSSGSTGNGGSGASGGTTGSGGATGSGGTTGNGGATGNGGTSASGGTTGSGGTVASGGNTGAGGTSTGGDTGAGGTVSPTDGGTDAACQTADFKFVPQIPTVYLLVSESGSMFHCLNATSTESSGNAICINSTTNAVDMNNTAWYVLKTAIEQVLPQLDSQVRFGFSTIAGTNPAGGGSCPSQQGTLTGNVAPALNNAAAIATLYDGIQFPPNSTQVGVKYESPVSYSVGNVTTALMADTDPGAKYILLITNGMPDYCDDSNVLCPPDSVVWKLQTAAAAGIKTIVFGIQSTLFQLAPGVLQAYANAGAGEPTIAPVNTGGSANDFFDQCDGIAGWANDLKAKGTTPMRGDTLGTYSATMGPTVPYTPNAADQTMLVNQLSAAISGVKSCSFDLSDVGGKSIKVDTTMLGKATVKIQGTVVPQDATNGWSMSDPTTLVLNGTACTTWQTPNNNDINFAFPCSSIIFE